MQASFEHKASFEHISFEQVRTLYFFGQILAIKLLERLQDATVPAPNPLFTYGYNHTNVV